MLSMSHSDTTLKLGDIMQWVGHLIRHHPEELCGLYSAELRENLNERFSGCNIFTPNKSF